MATISHEPSRVVQAERRWWFQLLVPEMWASLTIIVMWLAVLFDAVFGPDIVTTGAGGGASSFRQPLPWRCSRSSPRGSSHDTASGLDEGLTEGLGDGVTLRPGGIDHRRSAASPGLSRRATARPACQPGSASTGRRLNRVDGEAAAHEQPGDQGVRVPHLACSKLVASPDRRRHLRHEVESRWAHRDPRSPAAGCRPPRRRLGSRRRASDGSRTGNAKRPAHPAADRAFRDDASLHPVSVTYRCLLDHELPLGHADHERGVVQIWLVASRAAPRLPRIRARSAARNDLRPLTEASRGRRWVVGLTRDHGGLVTWARLARGCPGWYIGGNVDAAALGDNVELPLGRK